MNFKQFKSTILLLVVIVMMSMVGFGCSKVPAGNVGVKVYLLGTEKGVDDTEVLEPGRYFIGWNRDLFIFPTFTQNYTWTKSVDEQSSTDESITFQTMEGLDVNTDIGITYRIEKSKVTEVFQKYRKGVDEITSVYLRNMVRDAFIKVGSNYPVEYVYGKGKNELITKITEETKRQVEDIGIIVEKIYLVGSMRLPDEVIKALNAKISATQKAQQRENELREAEANAKKKVAEAEGEALSIITKAKAQAEANILLSSSITPELVQYEAIKKWDGILPKVGSSAGIIPMVDLKE